jgi:hypothetical protein
LRKILLIAAMLTISLIGGCLKNPFATRNSEDPVGVTGTWETPASPETAIRNLLYACNEKNVQNYRSCLSDNFVFSSPEDSIRAESQGSAYLYYNWDKGVETFTAQNIFSTYSASGHQLLLSMMESGNNPDSIGDTVAVIYREYVIRLVVADSIHIDTATASGLATFRLNQGQYDFWSIYFWQDLPDTVGGFTWGQFKAMYRQ